MNTILSEYLERRFKRDTPVQPLPQTQSGGPVITISRAFGCPAKKIADMLIKELNKPEHGIPENKKWHWIGKEVLEDSAKELHLNSNFVRTIADTENTGALNDILLSLSNKYYPGDIKIKKTIGEIIQSYAKEGNVVIVGRAGAELTQKIPTAIHIKLTAPIEWRINHLSQKHMISLDEAQKRIREIDTKRQNLREYFKEEGAEASPYDITFNYYTCSAEEIVHVLLEMMKLRMLI